jgi:hypothetical protein
VANLPEPTPPSPNSPGEVLRDAELIELVCESCKLPVSRDRDHPCFGTECGDYGWQHHSCEDARLYHYDEEPPDELVEHLQAVERSCKDILDRAQKQYDIAYNELVAVLQPEKWRGLFHSWDEIKNAKEITFAIQDFLQNDAVTMIGGLPEHGKSLIVIADMKSLLDGTKLFDRFEVKRKATRVLYLVPEGALTPIKERLYKFGLQEHKDRLFVRTLSADGDLALSDARLLKAVQGADVILDTAIRFLPEGVDENKASDMRKFSKLLFALLKEGARTVIGLHHSAKSLGNDDISRYLTLENILRGSGDIGAMCGTCWGSYRVDRDSMTVFLQAVKARDFQAPKPLLLQGRPSIDTNGCFTVLPHQVEDLAGAKRLFRPQKPGPKPTPEPELDTKTTERDAKMAEAERLTAEGKSQRQVAKEVGVSQSAIRDWSKGWGSK